jgi:CBS domain-containing protein
MSAPAITIREDARIAYAAGLMLQHRVHRLPVVDHGGRCVAMLTRTDVFRPLIPDFDADPLYLQKARRPAPAWEGRDLP